VLKTTVRTPAPSRRYSVNRGAARQAFGHLTSRASLEAPATGAAASATSATAATRGQTQRASQRLKQVRRCRSSRAWLCQTDSWFSLKFNIENTSYLLIFWGRSCSKQYLAPCSRGAIMRECATGKPIASLGSVVMA